MVVYYIFLQFITITITRQHDISGNKLAQKANISQSELSAIERGEQDPTFYMVEKICSALNTTVQDLIVKENTTEESIDLEEQLLDLRSALIKKDITFRKTPLEDHEIIVIKHAIDMLLSSIREMHEKDKKKTTTY